VITLTILLECNNLKKSYGDIDVLKDINIKINENEKIGIVGKNGSGKSTLINILTGKLTQSEGQLKWYRKPNLKFIPQRILTDYSMVEDIFRTSDRMELRQFLNSLNQIGIDNISDWNEERFDNLSGGEKSKLFLSYVWSLRSDFLILDEPTNHLDLNGIEWLNNKIRDYNGTLLVVSHDRHFLDEWADKIIEIDDGASRVFKGNYSRYKELKAAEHEAQMAAFTNQEKTKHQIANQIEQFKSWSSKAHNGAAKKADVNGVQKGGKEFYRSKAKKKDIQIKSKIKKLEKIDLNGVDKPKEEHHVQFEFNTDQKHGKRIVEADDISKTYDNLLVFKKSSFYIQRGDKICLFGDNGSGKTTLIKGLLGEEALDSGELFISKTIKISYLSQDLISLVDHKTIIEHFDTTTNAIRGHSQSTLAQLGFSERDCTKKISELSLGEKTRVKLAMMIQNNNGLLILDEPTNNLDITGRELLENALKSYSGTLILISHDRRLLEEVCNKVIAIKKKKIRRHEKTLKEFLAKDTSVGIDKREREKEKMLLENKIAQVISKISFCKPDTDRYIELDHELNALFSLKNEMTSRVASH